MGKQKSLLAHNLYLEITKKQFKLKTRLFALKNRHNWKILGMRKYFSNWTRESNKSNMLFLLFFIISVFADVELSLPSTKFFKC